MSTTFIAVYRGPTISSARLVATSVDPALVADVASRLLREPSTDGDDPATTSIDQGRRAALRVIRREASATSAQT